MWTNVPAMTNCMNEKVELQDQDVTQENAALAHSFEEADTFKF